MNDELALAIPALQITHTDGKSWRVAAKWPDGRVEEIATFESEAKANGWIARDFQMWLDTRKKGAPTSYRG